MTLTALVISSALTGCGSGISEPEIALVTGTVKVDGKPEPDLEVIFEPKEGGKDAGGTSTALTDEDGHYELKYKGGEKSGAVVGNHTVRINRFAGGGPAGGESGAASDPLPPQYNTQTTLTAEVSAGENTKDFDLTSK